MFKAASKTATAKTAGGIDGVGSSGDSSGGSSDGVGSSGDSVGSSSGSIHSSSDELGRQKCRRKWRNVGSNDRSLLWTSQNKREFGHLCMYTRKQNQHRCLTSCLIRSLVRHLEAMVLQLYEYLMRCLSDIHTSPHQRKRPRIMVQVCIYTPIIPHRVCSVCICVYVGLSVVISSSCHCHMIRQMLSWCC